MAYDLSKAKVFFASCLFFIISTGLASFLPVKILHYNLAWFAGLIIFTVLLILFWQNKPIRLIFWVGLVLFLAVWRFGLALPIDTPDKIWHYNGQEINITGLVVKEPDVRNNNVKYEVETQNFASLQRNIGGKILITTNLYPRYNYGDELEIKCQLEQPEEFNDFSYDRYLAKYDIYSVCYYPEIIRTDSGRGNWFYKNIFILKDKLRLILDSGLAEPEAGLAQALILGDKRDISQDIKDDFSQAGVSHLLAISGLHISIIGALVMSFLLGLGFWRQQAFWLASLFLFFYIILIGAPASALRAGLMGFLALLALNSGRLNRLTNSVMFAGAALLFVNPKMLRDDIGFQLSFLAVIGIIYIYPVIDRWLDKIELPKLRGIRDIIAITISAQVLALPIIAYNFSIISLISPLANLLILWTLPFIMIAMLIGLLLSFFLPAFSFIFFLPAGLLIKYIIIIADKLTEIPYAYIKLDYLNFFWIVLYYLIIIGFMVRYSYNNK